MKACPFCAETIQDAAIKCRFCGERLGPGGAVSPLPPDDELIAQGYMVGNFKLVAPLGSGGMGSVFVGEHPDIGKRIAVKIMRNDLTANQEAVDRFLNEAKTVVRLRHPSIVDVLDYGVLDSGQRYLVMEFLDGEDLKSYRRTRPRLSPHEAAGIVWQILDALAAAHAASVVHRDIKPENIFVIPWGRRSLVKLLDFGIAKLLGETERESRQTQTGVILGTPAYMAPEQAAGRRDLDGRTDIYSVGIILYELVVGRRPFQSPNPGELLLMQQSSPPPPPRLYVPSIPPLLEQLILCCLEKDPDRRPQSASELRDELQGLFPTLPRQPLTSSDGDGNGESGATLLDAQEGRAGKNPTPPPSTSGTGGTGPRNVPRPNTGPKMPAVPAPAAGQGGVPRPNTGPKMPAVVPPGPRPKTGQNLPAIKPDAPKNRQELAPEATNSGPMAALRAEPRPAVGAGSIQLRATDLESTTLSQTRGEVGKIVLPPEEPAQRPRRWLLPAFAGLVALSGISGVLLLDPFSEPPASQVSANPGPAMVRIHIDSRPNQATVYAPNQVPPLGETPLDVDVPPQGRTVILKSPGFQDRTIELRPDHSSSLIIPLEPTP